MLKKAIKDCASQFSPVFPTLLTFTGNNALKEQEIWLFKLKLPVKWLSDNF